MVISRRELLTSAPLSGGPSVELLRELRLVQPFSKSSSVGKSAVADMDIGTGCEAGRGSFCVSEACTCASSTSPSGPSEPAGDGDSIRS